MDELHLRDPGHNPTSSELFWKDLLQKKVCAAEIDEKLTALFIGLRWVQNCETRSRNMEGEHSRTQETLDAAPKIVLESAWQSQQQQHQQQQDTSESASSSTR